MKKIIFILAISCFLASTASARYQRGYYKPSTGTYISGHYKTNSDSTRLNNYSTRGNYNPYTGAKGYNSPYKTPSYSYDGYKKRKK